jgi:cytochrome c oxidase subunit 3
MTTPPAAPPPPTDPMPSAELGTWLFLASESMFFAGLLAAFIVLRSSAGDLFARSAAVVSRPATLMAIALLVASSMVLWTRRVTGRRWAITGVLAVAFLVVQDRAATQLRLHGTVVTATAVYDGVVAHGRGMVVVTGVRVPLPPSFDVHRTTPGDLRNGVRVDVEAIPEGDVRIDANYGPSRNNYFGCYFLVAAAHALHVVGGLVALAWLTMRTRRGTATLANGRAVSLYWQFVNGVGIIALVLLARG